MGKLKNKDLAREHSLDLFWRLSKLSPQEQIAYGERKSLWQQTFMKNWLNI
jgi:hypothetical protein